MRVRQSGTSVLAALVFVAIFVLFISGYKIASQSAGEQAAAAASALKHAVTCAPGSVYTVDMQVGSGSITSASCFKPDSREPSGMAASVDYGTAACNQANMSKCVVNYCPPSSYVTQSGTCFDVAVCDNDSCLKAAIQNGSQPMQAANIIAARVLNDRGAKTIRSPGSSEPLALADMLSESGRTFVGNVIEQTAQAAAANNFDEDAISEIADGIRDATPVGPASGPAAQISCQPKIAESGMKVGIAFGCANSVSSIGGGFSTGERLWGATEERIEPNLPNGTMTYELSCSDGIRSASASCSVAVMKPFMLLTSQSDETATSFAWVTRGMDVCELSAADDTELSVQFQNPIPQGGALSVPTITKDTNVTLMCTTVGGTVKEVTTTIHAVR